MTEPSDKPTFDPSAADFYGRVYDELRKIAYSKMANEYAYSTIQGTALVHEAWLKLGGERQPEWANRAHFFSAAAEAMRRILIDRARKRKSQRHGGDLNRVNFTAVDVLKDQVDSDDQLLELNEALDKLAAFDPQKAELVKLRYFSGLTFDEVADILGVSTITAKRWWAYARSWLFAELSSS